MSIFKGTTGLVKKTTKDLHIGNPEAESESNNRSRVRLDDVFSDFLDVFPELETEKFIITGRKGNGKSAIGQILFKKAKESPNRFCAFIRKGDIDLEEIVQISQNVAGQNIGKEILFKWIILTKTLDLITKNEAVQNLPEIKMLRDFLKKNSGFVNINRFEIKEILQTSGVEIYIEKLIRFFRIKGNREVKLSGQKAPFYKLIPSLEQAILLVLTSEDEKIQENSYTLIFDDLDIEFKAEKEESVESLLNLIRIAKHYNNNFFSENEIDAKIVILLRDDISDVLIKQSADMAKIFSSYSIPLYWYEHELYRRDENLTPLKRFINKRIAHAFDKLRYKYLQDDPWKNLIDADHEVNESSFKYVIDHTFQSPRDLLLFFQDLSKYQFKIPLKLRELNILIGRYAPKCKEEIDNLLTIHFSQQEIENIYYILKALSTYTHFNYQSLVSEIEKFPFKNSEEKICEILYNYSLLGNKDIKGNKVYFKYREEDAESFAIDTSKLFVLHRIIIVYFRNQK